MSARDELRDPWGWLVAAVCGGLAWAVLAGRRWCTAGSLACLVGIARRPRHEGRRGCVARLGCDSRRPWNGLGTGFPRPPRDSIQAGLLARSREAVERMEDLVGRPSDPWIAGEVR